MTKLESLLHASTGLSLISGYLMYNRRYLLSFDKKREGETTQSISVIIPARNEEKRLPKLLKSLSQQSMRVECIVMDDDSNDRTAEIAREMGAKVYNVTYDNNGNTWIGKSYACYLSASYTVSDILIFMDADVELNNEHALEAIIQSYARQQYRGLMSIQPYHVVYKPYEHLSAMFNLMTVVGTNSFSTLSKSKGESLAFGPVTVMNKSDYILTQGHKNAASHIIEGFSLGKAFQRCQLPVTRFEGQGFVSFRMYEAGFKTMIEGWTKHLAVGASSTQPHIMMLIILWMVGCITSFSGLALSLFMKTLSFKRMALSYSLYTLQFIRLHRRVGRFSILFLAINPILFLVFILVYINSYRHIHYTKQVKWKGRQFSIK
ncbi:glycosyltransferase family 2 protein [Staphylococcus haemolyticus]|uniref:glycosyltransferase family 2 protein n=1 Tax=Staphylococcus haemolyticus TaxID=1283 RepID=UPI00051CC5EF|nr:glycosyltransferase family 2 protein [Staphylococcus haemolyticus]KGJ26250.1 4,4'-diaponeurosporenoate glycosyltransferase [Staphylococcus haemolyticus]KGJ30317.1 4,4'-diaponeurosporenoate glycosyltransferase [Staphylococcus haemolyticus]MCH4328111.1 glycosyltransferase [Staphylococcus haemolyticus]